MSRADEDRGVSAMPRDSRTADGTRAETDAAAPRASTAASTATKPSGMTPTVTEAAGLPDAAEAERTSPGSDEDVLVGAAGSGPAGARADRAPAWVRLWWTPLVLFAVLGLLAGGAGLRVLLDRPPADNSVDVGFARDMSEHHSQAVQMAMVEFNHGGNADVRNMAQDIALSQQREIGVMDAWLSGWGRTSTSANAPMAWMADDSAGGHGDHGTAGTGAMTDGTMPGGGMTGRTGETVRMPGMATESELGALAAASGRDLDVQFLTLMIHHHRGGVAMAQYASMHADDDRVRALARAMVVNQAWEIDQMQRYLEQLGAPRA
ncbi:DUF305 domain-containing protein [Parafrankia sp. BMG5.11]|nr:DUF305 domain-containing protein [Parafrankia sp. BMG5.11]SQD97208.1 conserved hypothetical protein [Parafrankia sp. Ea1.12]